MHWRKWRQILLLSSPSLKRPKRLGRGLAFYFRPGQAGVLDKEGLLGVGYRTLRCLRVYGDRRFVARNLANQIDHLLK